MPTKINEIYKCEICGNIVEIIHASAGTLVCCGQQMILLEEKTKDNGMEKHVPEIKRWGDVVIVKIGSVPHPMEEKHHIEWIEIIADGKVQRKFMNPGENPEAVFETNAQKILAREYCNVHGLWKSA